MCHSASDSPRSPAPGGWARRKVVRLLGTLAAVPLASALDLTPSTAARHVRDEHNRRDGGKKTIMCYQSETVRVATKRRKQWLRKGATRGKCQGCTPNCGGTCGGDDGCGGVCNCASGLICAAGTCAPCTVPCTGDPAACGEALATALAGIGDIVLCPGTYQGNFTINRSVQIFGSGSGSNPTVDSILDGNAAGRTFGIQDGVSVLLSGLAITNGDGGIGGGGIRSSAATLTIERCTITGNTARDGAGLSIFGGVTTVRNSTITQNGTEDGHNGGGLDAENATLIIEGSVFNANTIGDNGGGLYLSGGSCTFDSASSVTGNSALDGGGIYGATGDVPTVALNGATVSGNTGGNCGGSITC